MDRTQKETHIAGINTILTLNADAVCGRRVSFDNYEDLVDELTAYVARQCLKERQEIQKEEPKGTTALLNGIASCLKPQAP